MAASDDYPWADLAEVEQSLELEHFPSLIFALLAGQIQKNVTRFYLEPHKLGFPEWRILALVSRYKTIPLRRVTRIAWMDKGQISRVVDNLVKRELIVRKTDPTHARRNILDITPEGAELNQSLINVARQYQATLLGALSARERKTLYTALAKMGDAARAIGLNNRASKRRKDSR